MTELQRRAFVELAKNYTASATASRKAATIVLIKEGILAPDGRLALEYGGKKRRKVARSAA